MRKQNCLTGMYIRIYNNINKVTKVVCFEGGNCHIKIIKTFAVKRRFFIVKGQEG